MGNRHPVFCFLDPDGISVNFCYRKQTGPGPLTPDRHFNKKMVETVENKSGGKTVEILTLLKNRQQKRAYKVDQKPS